MPATFTESNTVERFIVKQLTGVNLNDSSWAQEPEPTYGTGGASAGPPRWRYVPPSALAREETSVLLEADVKKALIRLNPSIQAQPARADEVIYKLRAVIGAVADEGLVGANERFGKWLRGEHSLPFGPDGQHETIHLLDFRDPRRNDYVVTTQLHVRTGTELKIPDVVLFVNGIPLVLGEAKTPVRPAISWLDGAHEVHHVYEPAITPFFVPNLLSFATEGKELFYGGVRTPLDFWAPWRLEDDAPDALAKLVGIQEVGKQLASLLRPETLLDFLQHFTFYATTPKGQKVKVVARYQQVEGANAIVARVVDGQVKKGLLWHFQGSGKSLLMVFAAQKLRRHPALASPTVVIVVDRTDLDTQISSTFTMGGVANMVNAENIAGLRDLLEKDARKIIITMMHKFQDAPPNLNLRHNIILLVDEAHRTQEGDLGSRMREALPNAFLFGLTGTPINKRDKNTFAAFGSETDAGGYLSRYTYPDSLRDKQTLELRFEPRLPNIRLDKEKMDLAFAELTNDLEEGDKNTLSKKAAQLATFLKAPKRVRAIAEDIVQHFLSQVAPHGFKGMVVAPDREACILYKNELDALLPAEASAVVISTTANDSKEFKALWALDTQQQAKLLARFNDPNDPLQLLIVTAKLLTGFDAPVLQTMYLDKSLKDHTLLQAICRTNRLFPRKTFGRVVDYFGVFDDTGRALAFDEETMAKVVASMAQYKADLPDLVDTALSHFPNVDRTLIGFEGLEAAQNCLPDNAARDAFAADYGVLNRVWEALSPDSALAPFRTDYRWLSQIYTSVRPTGTDDGRLLWFALGGATTQLIHENMYVEGVNPHLDPLVLTPELVEGLMRTPDKVKHLVTEIAGRLGGHGANPVFLALSERLEKVRERAEKGLISSIDFIKELCQLATETLEAEKAAMQTATESAPAALPPAKTAESALTELFQEVRSPDTPAIVERIVKDIDAIVRKVRFPSWQTSTEGKRLVGKSLRETLLRYQLHKDQDLYAKAYGYIEQYY